MFMFGDLCEDIRHFNHFTTCFCVKRIALSLFGWHMFPCLYLYPPTTIINFHMWDWLIAARLRQTASRQEPEHESLDRFYRENEVGSRYPQGWLWVGQDWFIWLKCKIPSDWFLNPSENQTDGICHWDWGMDPLDLRLELLIKGFSFSCHLLSWIGRLQIVPRISTTCFDPAVERYRMRRPGWTIIGV